MNEPIELDDALESRFNDVMPPLFDWMAAKFQKHYRDWDDATRQNLLSMAFVKECGSILTEVERLHSETYIYTPVEFVEHINAYTMPQILDDLEDYTAKFYKEYNAPHSIDATPFETDEERVGQIFCKLEPILDEKRWAYANC